VSRNEAVDFDWGDGAPTGARADLFSVRWSGAVLADIGGTYRFQTVSDDGVRLFVNDRLLISNWTNHGDTTDTATIELEAGKRVPIRMEMYEVGGGATARLHWEEPGGGGRL
jgi:hypothetical protein